MARYTVGYNEYGSFAVLIEAGDTEHDEGVDAVAVYGPFPSLEAAEAFHAKAESRVNLEIARLQHAADADPEFQHNYRGFARIVRLRKPGAGNVTDTIRSKFEE